MNIDFERLCSDHSIPFETRGGTWVQVQCPFCDDQLHHLGLNSEGGYGNCWKCGWHPADKVVETFLGCSPTEAGEVLERYKIALKGSRSAATGLKAASAVVYPPVTLAMQEAHRRYLRKRRFDPEELEEIWQLQGTGPLGPYKFRIIAPIFYKGRLISYQGRDMTGKSSLKYKACKEEDEVRKHKHCLYGLDLVPGNSIVIVEGITDAWRLGPGAVATFGIGFTQEQLLLLTEYRDKYILFDPDDNQATERSESLASALSVFDGTVEIIEVDYPDPAEMPQRKANKLMKELLK